MKNISKNLILREIYFTLTYSVHKLPVSIRIISINLLRRLIMQILLFTFITFFSSALIIPTLLLILILIPRITVTLICKHHPPMAAITAGGSSGRILLASTGTHTITSICGLLDGFLKKKIFFKS